jgi:hypothetical protein
MPSPDFCPHCPRFFCGRRIYHSMNYQERLFLAFVVGLLAFAIACFGGLIVTSHFSKSNYPDVITTMPNLKP